jgi:hypothetical protein
MLSLFLSYGLVAKMDNYFMQFADYSAGYQKPEIDITEVVFENKLNLIQRKLSLIQDKIEQRSQIKDCNLQDILDDECTVDNLILAQPDVFTQYQPPSQQTIKLEELKLKMNEKRRMELANSWRDVSMLYNMGIDAYLDIMKQDDKKKMMESLND